MELQFLVDLNTETKQSRPVLKRRFNDTEMFFIGRCRLGWFLETTLKIDIEKKLDAMLYEELGRMIH